MYYDFLPVIVMNDVTLFPEQMLKLSLRETHSINAVKYSIKHNSLVILARSTVKNFKVSDLSALRMVSTVAKIKLAGYLEDTYEVTVEGVEVIELSKIEHIEKNNIIFATGNSYQYINQTSTKVKSLLNKVLEIKKNKFGNNPQSEYIFNYYKMKNNPEISIGAIAQFEQNLDAQKLIEEKDTEKRLQILIDYFNDQNEKLDIVDEIHARVAEKITASQREVILREQLAVIEDELGIGDGTNQFRMKITNADIPDHVKEVLLKEEGKMSRMSPQNPEYTLINNYIDLVLELPWLKFKEENDNILSVKKCLDQENYGLDKVKDRILEYISVRIKTNYSNNGPVICLVGPPGVGKTSVGISVANALNKEFIHMSLGGIHDESEIRGHRKTYIGAMPGRIIYNLSKAKTSNPLFLLDEIDKIGYDFKGDPSAALLEVLDPAQNYAFRDNYLEIPYDLSKVMFVATANSVADIPHALVDRMEIIEITGYTYDEKYIIAKNYLIPKIMKDNGLSKNEISFLKSGIDTVINNYTNESGVRKLNQKLAEISRKIIREMLESKLADPVESKDDAKFKIDSNEVKRILGPLKYEPSKSQQVDAVGIVNGLAWTLGGGETLIVEALLIPGSGEIILTGQLGDVMKESAKTALSLVKNYIHKEKLSTIDYSKYDLHIHVPEGAVQKDGPSAGITMATAIYSIITNTKVKKDVAMTGEVTLTGNVLPIGGLKEKLLAAIRNNIEVVILPKDNEKDFNELNSNIKKSLKVYYATNIEEVFKHTFVKNENN